MRGNFSGLNEILQKKLDMETQREIEWFQSLLESLEEGETAVAIELVRSAITVKKRQLEN